MFAHVVDVLPDDWTPFGRCAATHRPGCDPAIKPQCTIKGDLSTTGIVAKRLVSDQGPAVTGDDLDQMVLDQLPEVAGQPVKSQPGPNQGIPDMLRRAVRATGDHPAIFEMLIDQTMGRGLIGVDSPLRRLLYLGIRLPAGHQEKQGCDEPNQSGSYFTEIRGLKDWLPEYSTAYRADFHPVRFSRPFCR
jgi:hypothetical protein